MKNLRLISRMMTLTITFLIPLIYPNIKNECAPNQETKDIIILPEPHRNSATSIEEAIFKRQSVRNYKKLPLSLEEVSQLVWSAQGITHSGKLRSAPSAGATYPLELYVVVGNVTDLSPGIYQYIPKNHRLKKIAAEDVREKLASAAFHQPSVKNGAIDLVFSAIYTRTTKRYGDRGIAYVHMEVGHASENVSLQAVSLGLGTVVIGAFDDKEVKKILALPEEEEPLYIMPVGRT